MVNAVFDLLFIHILAVDRHFSRLETSCPCKFETKSIRTTLITLFLDHNQEVFYKDDFVDKLCLYPFGQILKQDN